MADEARVGRILAVDDDLAWREILGEELDDMGIAHDIAEDANEAIERLRGGGYTGVITDGLEGRWPQVVGVARELGIAAVLFSGDGEQIKYAAEDDVEGFSKVQAAQDAGIYTKMIAKLDVDTGAKVAGDLDTLFPTDKEDEKSHALTMGFEDFSKDGQATKLFESMTQRQREAVHRFCLNGPKLTIQHLKVITDLVDGYDLRDPNRTAEEAMEGVLAEIDASRSYYEVVASNEIVPALIGVRPIDMAEGDADRQVWVTRSTVGEEGQLIKMALPDFDVVESFVRDPTHRDQWQGSFFNLIGSSAAIIDRDDII